MGDVFEQPGEGGGVIGGEVAVVAGFQVQRDDVGVGLAEQGDDELAGAQGAELFGAADFGFTGAAGEDGEEEGRGVEGLLDLFGPGGAAGDAALVEPGIEAVGEQVAVEAAGQFGAVFARVGEEELGRRAGLHRRGV